jgi:lipopolysaccharide transport system ATP-binding protein
MTDTVISVENLSKRYLLAHQFGAREHRYLGLRHVIEREARTFARKAVDLVRGRDVVQGDVLEEFWALRNVNFEIKRGEVVGIIGRNGAGKSTLLKILSRITEPTEGRAVIRGRIASLLEVGTGFHVELTGRENIFLNGAILGMTQREVRRKFDEIVAFADVERFLDTPVKRYSSGMYVRLAFAVAAHLEPEILVVDEVLAVGDAEFQKKCLGKMEEASRRDGRTVLFVSHNLAAMADLTRRGIVIESGSIVADGPIIDAIKTYLSRGRGQKIYVRPKDAKSDIPHISRAEIFTSDPNGVHRFGEPLEIKFWIRHEKPMINGCFSVYIINQFQQPIAHAWIFNADYPFGNVTGETLLVCRFPSLRLNVGQFSLRMDLTEPPGGPIYEKLEGICPFEVVRTDRRKFWDWNQQDCAYHEKWEWVANTTAS